MSAGDALNHAIVIAELFHADHKASDTIRDSGYAPIVRFFLSWHLGAERQTCHVTLIVPHVMN